MREDYLHYTWKYKKFDLFNLFTSDGHKIEIIQAGMHNSNAGPDFLHARLKIGNTEWAGHVEIHLRSSDWNKHLHQHDASYNNVILHVVYEHDAEIKNEKGIVIPTLELKKHLNTNAYSTYENFIRSKKQIPCAGGLRQMEQIHISSMMQRALINRLERKVAAVNELLKETHGDWEEATFRLLCRTFGLKVNGESFTALARTISYKNLLRCGAEMREMEAFLFGQAGFLELKKGDDYYQDLKFRYQQLKLKYNLNPISPKHWKFARMHPQNFPTVRIAQLAAIFFHTKNLFSRFVETDDIRELRSIFAVYPDPYWDTHFTFFETVKAQKKKPGVHTIANVIINTAVPVLFAYGKSSGNESLENKALRWLEEVKPEKNGIVREMQSYGFPVNNSFETQALIELKNIFCEEKKCLTCSIGVQLLGK